MRIYDRLLKNREGLIKRFGPTPKEIELYVPFILCAQVPFRVGSGAGIYPVFRCLCLCVCAYDHDDTLLLMNGELI